MADRYYLKEYRLKANLSQGELSRRSDVDRDTISDMELRPEKLRRPSTIEKLCLALGIQPAELKTPPKTGIPPDAIAPDLSEDELVDQILAIRYRGDMSAEAVQRLTNALIKSLIDERGPERKSKQ